MPLLLLVQQVGGGGDSPASPLPAQRAAEAGCCSSPYHCCGSQLQGDSGQPMGATQQPPHTLRQGWEHGCPSVPQGWCPAADGGTRKELVTPKSQCHASGPLSSSLALGRRHGVLQDPTLHSSGMRPQRAQCPHGAVGLVGRGMSASSPARTCGSSPSSTSASWTPSPTRPSTGGSSAWMQWVSPSHWATPL